jgi:8-oxo-dGTP pyrophosphatase MutT (NUDIX family)
VTEPAAGRPAIRLPPHFAARARDVLDGTVAPVTPRDAATVMLLRPGPSPAGGGAGGSGLQVYMLRRRPSMAFAPGAYVFPGGSVDATDDDDAVAWAGPDAGEWGRLLDAPPGLARALVCAAVRETFEESGVLLAGPAESGSGAVPGDAPAEAGDAPADVWDAGVGDEGWEADRQAVLAGTLTLAGLLRRRGLVLRSDLLRPWARWITPVTEERRYDTRFFAAALPAGQHARDVGGEADETAWMEPGAALAAASRGEIALMPPTAVTLGELRTCGQVPAALAARRRITALIPEVFLENGAAWLTVPAGLEYPL